MLKEKFVIVHTNAMIKRIKYVTNGTIEQSVENEMTRNVYDYIHIHVWNI